MNDIEIQFLGTRGSMAVDSEEYLTFGGATISTLVKVNNTYIVFDAGSGFMNISKNIEIKENEVTTIHIFISHTHLDHIMGLLVCNIMFNKNVLINIYGATRNGLTIEEQLNELMKTPIWPVNSKVFKENVSFYEVKNELYIENVKIVSAEGNHPGGATLYSLEYNNKKLVYATDFEINKKSIEILTNFSKKTDLLICDGQYSNKDFEDKIGYGHSSWENSVQVAELSKCKKLCVFHHDPYSTDAYLLGLEKEMKSKNPQHFFARKDMVLLL